MAVIGSRRDMLHFGCSAAAALGIAAATDALNPVRAIAQGVSSSNESAEDLFYREDWFGEPWRKPETAILIHGNAESSLVWYAWIPRMGREFRVLRPDLPGLGRSRIPAGFEWTLPSLAAFVAHVLDKAGVDAGKKLSLDSRPIARLRASWSLSSGHGRRTTDSRQLISLGRGNKNPPPKMA
jgi:pimeloyl-ACP methyl ester carboxylesterase